MGSVVNMLKKVGLSSRLVSTVNDLDLATKIILPGVGAFDSCMNALNKSGLREKMVQKVQNKEATLLGICVGYQMLTTGSEEGREPGLSLLPAKTVKFVDPAKKFKIPHMGWNEIVPVVKHPLTKFFEPGADNRAYFVHSYCVQPYDQTNVILTTNYIHDFAAAMAKDNVMGVQFHPEKSHRYGMNLFRAFAEMQSQS